MLRGIGDLGGFREMFLGGLGSVGRGLRARKGFRGFRGFRGLGLGFRDRMS